MLCVLALAAGLRLWHLGENGLWIDEGYTAWLADRPIGSYHRLLRDDTAPPLYFYLARPAALLAPRSEFALRLPGVLFGALSVALVYALAVELLGSRLAGLTAAVLLATNRFHIIRCREARHYALYLALALAAMWCLVRLARGLSPFRPPFAEMGTVPLVGQDQRLLPQRWKVLFWVGFVLSSAAMIYTHNVGFFFLAGLLLSYPLSVWLNGASPSRERKLAGALEQPQGSSALPAPVAGDATRDPWYWPLIEIALASLAIAVLYLPWMPVLRAQLGQVLADYWIPRPTLDGVLSAMSRLVAVGPNVPRGFRGPVASPAMAGWLSDGFASLLWPMGVLGWIVWLAGRRDRRAGGLLIGLAVATGGVIGFSLLRRPVFMDKVILPAVVVPVLGAAALVALAMTNRSVRWLGVTGAVGLSAFATIVAAANLGMDVNEQWREATAWALARADPSDDLLLVDDPHNLMAAEWYLAGSKYWPVRWDSATPHLLSAGGSIRHAERTAALNALSADDLVAALKQAFRPGRKIWVIQRAYNDTLNPPVEACLKAAATEVSRREFHIVRVRLFEVRPDPPQGVQR